MFYGATISESEYKIKYNISSFFNSIDHFFRYNIEAIIRVFIDL